MTNEEALRVFGLSRIQSLETMKILRNAAAKQAHLTNDTQRLIQINAAWAVLSGKEEAEQAEKRPAVNHDGLSGIVKAKCRERTGTEFVLDWIMIPYGAYGGVDQVILTNPQRIEWDSSLNGFVRVDAAYTRKPYYDQTGFRTSDRGPVDGHSDGWRSAFQTEIKFQRVYCPHCRAPNVQWCEHCHTIFCHRNEEDYSSGEYECPVCSASYCWSGTGEPLKTRFDGKQIRSLMDLRPVSLHLPGQENIKLLKRR